ncbi:PREDICTED: uncharacterized protein LOC109125635 [Camelina sativa]|uniref:Uncharacterized protein LOC109125635 n=1 Tax=Camelina sativa TaxID=90675 RepID=A0ABM1Q8W0_CAMSA|nr:PREDICTED: uncharacterized protein LOC109125635 [Camelina sativa]
MEILVNSYHHQGVKRLAKRFVPMAFSPDGLIEGFYDPDMYNPEEGKFLVGLQFHPERMRKNGLEEFDFPGCPVAYQEFSKAVIACQKKLNSSLSVPKKLELNPEMENKRKILVRSFSLARSMYTRSYSLNNQSIESELEVGAEFLESNTALSVKQEMRLKEMGATMRNGGSFTEKLRLDEEKQRKSMNIMKKMNVERLSELITFYQLMGKISSEVLERKLHASANELNITSQ